MLVEAIDRASADDSVLASTRGWRHPFAQWQADPLRSPPALVARLRATPSAGDVLRVATISAVHRVIEQAAVPHVLPIRSVHRDANGRLVLAYRSVAATDVGTLLRRGPLAETRAFAILRQVCRSLAAAHAIGIDHRALGPASVLVEEDGDASDRVWIADFGIASLFDGDEGTGAIELHPTTPERVFGGGSETSEDVYLVGCLAFWLFTGGPPFVASDLATLQRCHAIEEPKRIAELAIAGVPEGIDEVVARALTKEPDERWADVAELDAQLGRIQRQRGITTPWDDMLPPRAVVTPPAANTLTTRGATMVLRTTTVLPIPQPLERATDPMAPTTAPSAAPRRAMPLVLVSIGFSIGLVALGLADGPAPADTNDFAAGRITPTQTSAPSPVAASLVDPATRTREEIERRSSARAEPPPVAPRPIESSASAPVSEVPLPPVPGPVPSVVTPAHPVATPVPAKAPRTKATRPTRADDDHEGAASCEIVRRSASEARRTHDWGTLLRLTSERSCWPADGERTRYRVKALMELRRFDDCVDAGRDATDAEVVRWVALCRKRAEVL